MATLVCTNCGATLRRDVWAGLPRTDMTPDQLEHYARWYGWRNGLCPDCRLLTESPSLSDDH